MSENNQLQELTALRAEYNKLCDELRYQDATICALKEELEKNLLPITPLIMHDIPDAPDWVAHAINELKDIAEWFDKQGKKDNGDFLRRSANMLEILAGAYEIAKRRAL